MRVLKFIKTTFCLTGLVISTAQAQNSLDEKQAFYSAQKEISEMLEGKVKPDYERAIYLTENAYYNNLISYQEFQRVLNANEGLIKSIIKYAETKSIKPILNYYIPPDSIKRRTDMLRANYAIHSYLTDTLAFVNDTTIILHYPFTYSNLDPLATNNWENTQVFNLLKTKSNSGNCSALTSLFYIYAQRFKTGAQLCTTQGHIFLEVKDENNYPFCVELASRAFPGTGSIETLTHTSNQISKNGYAMRALNLKQSIGLCLINLAKGYQNKFNCVADSFMLSCAELAIKHDAKNLNAMLLKAEILEDYAIRQNKPFSELKRNKEFLTYQNYLTNLYDIGYREMPIEMKNIILASISKDTSFHAVYKNHTQNPFVEKGRENGISLSGGIFEEDDIFKPELRYFRTVYDAVNKKIKAFAPQEKLYNNYDFDAVVFSLQIDPLAHKLPAHSPYSFCFNNPIKYNDPDGAYPVITITKEVVGKTQQRVIGYTNTGKTQYTTVNLYKVTVTDTEDKNFKMSFTVTRDAFAVRKGDAKNGKMKMTNVAFEPKDGDVNHYTAKVIPGGYPKGDDTKALKLTQYNSEVVHAEPNQASVELGYRTQPDVASGVMIHVGGYYEHQNGTTSCAASEGCFGVTDGKSSEENPSNDYSNMVLGKIINQANNSETDKGKILVIIQKREGDEMQKSKTENQQ